MKIISFNQKWIFKNELKNIPEQTVDLPHDAMLTEKQPSGMVKPALQELISPAENTAIEKTCSGRRVRTNQFS